MLELLADRELAGSAEARLVSRFTGVITASGDRARPLARCLVPGRSRSTSCLPNAGRSTTSAAAATTSTNASGRSSSFTPSIAFTFPGLSATAAPALIPFAGFDNLLKRRFEEAIEIFLAAASRARRQRRHLQRAGRQLPRARFPDPGRPGPPQRAQRARQPVDVPHRPHRRLSAAPPSRASCRRSGLPHPARGHARPHGPHAQRMERHFLPRHGFPGRRARPQRLHRSGGPRRQPAGFAEPRPPVEAWFRVIDQPVIRLTSVDLQASADVSSIAEVFDFPRDYLGLLKAGVIASGIVPPGIEGATQPLAALLARLTGMPGYGIEIVSKVNDIPKGSRLAVSTSLLACIIAVCMRATGQIHSLTGGMEEHDRRLVAARAILGEWLGGSGGGWQDSGGVWPGIKLIHGVRAAEGDPEFGISRGRLLPDHKIFTDAEVPREAREKLQQSLVLVHGGMAQDVGPILEMVTEKYLLRCETEWLGRRRPSASSMRSPASRAGRHPRARRLPRAQLRRPHPDHHSLGRQSLHQHADRPRPRGIRRRFLGLLDARRHERRRHGIPVQPANAKTQAQVRMQAIMSETRRQMERSVPFAMEPVVYDFAINERGTQAALVRGADALMPAGYYTLAGAPADPHRSLPPVPRAPRRTGALHRGMPLQGRLRGHDSHPVRPHAAGRATMPKTARRDRSRPSSTATASTALQHEQIRQDLRSGRIGLAQNRLPVTSLIEDAEADRVERSPSRRRSRVPLPRAASLWSLWPEAWARAGPGAPEW